VKDSPSFYLQRTSFTLHFTDNNLSGQIGQKIEIALNQDEG
jgi:hypothetical protein